MSGKSLINSVDDCVDECLRGFSKLHPHLEIHQPQKIVFDAGWENRKKVALISGGGSGHEPFPSGYVGSGMLTASVSGLIFTSPPSSHVLSAIRLAESEGVLLVVPNYTGDVLNFGLAAEIAVSGGIQVETLIVGEDIAQEVYGITNKTGKRGTCGLVLIIKIAGYLSELGYEVMEIKKQSNEALESMASLGLCVSPCSKPGLGLLFHLDPNEMELGVGVHGEAGVARFPLLTARDSVELVLGHLTGYLKLSEGDEVVAVVNNLGSLTHIEQWLVAGEVDKQLSGRGIKVLRLYAGCLFTSLNMAGVQVCLLKLNNNRDLILEALDHPTSASAWPGTKPKIVPQPVETSTVPPPRESFPGSFLLSSDTSGFIRECLNQISHDLTQQETHLNQLDSACGDGDCGSTFARMAFETLSRPLDFSNPPRLFFQLSLTMQESIGGTSGALYGLFFKGISDELERCESDKDPNIVSRSWRAGIEGIKKYSTARLGDRTMLDSLETACQVFERKTQEEGQDASEAFRSAVEASELACQSTKSMKASAGRASYTDRSQQTNVDAGAYAVTVWLSAILRVMDKRKNQKVLDHRDN